MARLREQVALARTQSCKTVNPAETRVGIVLKDSKNWATRPLFGETTVWEETHQKDRGGGEQRFASQHTWKTGFGASSKNESIHLFVLHRWSLTPTHLILFLFMKLKLQMNSIDTCCFTNYVSHINASQFVRMDLSTKDAVNTWALSLLSICMVQALFHCLFWNECSVMSSCWKCSVNKVVARKEQLQTNLLDEGRFKRSKFQKRLTPTLPSYNKAMQTQFSERRIQCKLFKFLFFLSAVDRDAILSFRERYEELRAAPFLRSFRSAYKRFFAYLDCVFQLSG